MTNKLPAKTIMEIINNINPLLKESEQALFIAGFEKCLKLNNISISEDTDCNYFNVNFLYLNKLYGMKIERRLLQSTEMKIREATLSEKDEYKHEYGKKLNGIRYYELVLDITLLKQILDNAIKEIIKQN